TLTWDLDRAARRPTRPSVTCAWRRPRCARRTSDVQKARQDPGGQVGLQPQLVVAGRGRDLPALRHGGDCAVDADHFAVPARAAGGQGAAAERARLTLA